MRSPVDRLYSSRKQIPSILGPWGDKEGENQRLSSQLRYQSP